MKTLHLILLPAALAGFAATGSAAPLEIDYTKSKIDVAVNATVDSFTGHLEKYETAIECDPASALPAKARVNFNFTDLKTGNADRDAAMLKWLEYDAHPKASFVLKGWRKGAKGDVALGELNMHGAKQDIAMPVVVKNNGGTWDITGEADFDYPDFNLPKIRKALVLTVDPLLKVHFHLVGKMPSST